MARHTLLACLLATPAVLLGAPPAAAQFGGIFDVLRPPGEIPNRQAPRPPPPPQQFPPQQQPPPPQVRQPQAPPGGIQSEPLPPPPGTAGTPPGTLPRPGQPAQPGQPGQPSVTGLPP